MAPASRKPAQTKMGKIHFFLGRATFLKNHFRHDLGTLVPRVLPRAILRLTFRPKSLSLFKIGKLVIMPRIGKKALLARQASRLAQQAPREKHEDTARKRRKGCRAALAKRAALKKLRDTYVAIVNGDTNTARCPHFMVGAASFRRLMAGSYGPEQAHGHLKLREDLAATLWRHCERESEALHPGAIAQPLRVHPYIPFVCAKADIYDPKMNLVIETKSTRDPKTLRQYDKTIIGATMLQLVITMECFDAIDGLLNVYAATDDPTTPGKLRPYRTHSISLRKQVPFFTPQWLGDVAKAYAFFLMRLLEVDFDEEIHSKFSNFVEHNLHELYRKHHSTAHRDARYTQQLSQKRREHLAHNFVTDFCREFGAVERKIPPKVDGEPIKPPEKDPSGYNRPVSCPSKFETDFSQAARTYTCQFADADRDKHFQRFSVCFKRNKAKASDGFDANQAPVRPGPYRLFENLTANVPGSGTNSLENAETYSISGGSSDYLGFSKGAKGRGASRR